MFIISFKVFFTSLISILYLSFNTYLFCILSNSFNKSSLKSCFKYVKSFILIFDSSSSEAANINGSSVEGRLGQLIATIFLINLNVKTFLFGHGYGYVAYFLENGEKNALTGEFEGELLSSLLSYGIIGTILIMLLSYYFCFYLVFYLYRKQQIPMEAKTFLVLYIFSKFLFSCLVGAASEHLWYICLLFFCAQSIFINKKNV